MALMVKSSCKGPERDVSTWGMAGILVEFHPGRGYVHLLPSRNKTVAVKSVDLTRIIILAQDPQLQYRLLPNKVDVQAFHT